MFFCCVGNYEIFAEEQRVYVKRVDILILMMFFCRKLLTKRQNFLNFTLGKKWKLYYNTKRKTKEEQFEKYLYHKKFRRFSYHIPKFF